MMNKRKFTAIVKNQWRLTADGFSIQIDDTHKEKRRKLLNDPRYLHQAILAEKYFATIEKEPISQWHEDQAFPSKFIPILCWQYRMEFSLGPIIAALIALGFECKFKWYEPFEPCFGISRKVFECEMNHLSLVLSC